MIIYKKVRIVLLSFNNKVIREINFGKTSQKFVKLQVPAIRLNDRSNTLNQSIKKIARNIITKPKMHFSKNEKHFVVTDY